VSHPSSASHPSFMSHPFFSMSFRPSPSFSSSSSSHFVISPVLCNTFHSPTDSSQSTGMDRNLVESTGMDRNREEFEYFASAIHRNRQKSQHELTQTH
jgi:hypothetical protein